MCACILACTKICATTSVPIYPVLTLLILTYYGAKDHDISLVRPSEESDDAPFCMVVAAVTHFVSTQTKTGVLLKEPAAMIICVNDERR